MHNTCAGRNHFWPRALGNALRYGSTALTYLNEADHTALHAALNEFLRGVTKILPDGSIVDMLPRLGNAGKDVVENFSLLERDIALRYFYTGFQDGRYLRQFAEEVKAAMEAGMQ